MMIIDLTPQLAPIVWALDAALVLSAAVIVFQGISCFLSEHRGGAFGRRFALLGGSH